MTRRGLVKVFLGLIGLGETAGCGGGITEGESVLATTPTLRIRVSLNRTTERTIGIPRGSTVLTAIQSAFPYRKTRRTTIINGAAGHWQYTIDGIKPWGYAGDVHLISNCHISLRRFSS